MEYSRKSAVDSQGICFTYGYLDVILQPNNTIKVTRDCRNVEHDYIYF